VALLLLLLAGLAQRSDGAARGASHRVGASTATPGPSDASDGLATALRAVVSGRVRDGLALQPPTLTVSGPPNSLRAVTIRLVNTGTTTWSGAYALNLVSGPSIGLPARLALPGVAPGELLEAPVVVRLPSQVGRVVSATWVMRNATGRPFGPLLRLVTRAGVAAAVSTVPPVPQATATVRSTPLTASPTATGTALSEPPTAPPTATGMAPTTQTASPTVQQGPVGSPTPPPPSLSPTPLVGRPTATTTLTATLVATMTQTLTPTVAPTEGTATLATPTPLASATSPVAAATSSPTATSSPLATPGTPASIGTVQRGPVRLAALPVRLAPSGGTRRWLFGGVALGARDRVELALLNLSSHTAHTWVTLAGSGGTRVEAYLVVGPRRVRRVALNDLIGPAPAVAAEVRGDVPLVVERVISHANDIDEGTTGAVASGHPAGVIAVAGGVARAALWPDERQTFSVYNPGVSGQSLGLLSVPTGPRAARRPPALVTVGPHAVVVLNNAAAPGGALVTGSVARSLLVEETTSYGTSNGLTALPLAPPAIQWYFAPTVTRTGGHSYLTVLNPGSVPLTATLAPVGGDSRSEHAFGVAAGAQTVVEPATLLPDSAATAWLTLRAPRPVLVSRVTKLPPAQEPQLARSYVAGLATTGVAALSRRVAFAAGDTRAAFTGVGETLFLLNPHNQATTVQLTYLTDLGRMITRRLTLGTGLAAMVVTDPSVGATLHGVLVEAGLPIAATMLWQFNAGAYALQDNGAPLDGGRS